MVDRIIRGQYSMTGKNWRHISSEGKDFVRSLLVELDRCPTAREALFHPWFSSETDRSEQKPDLGSWKNAQANLIRYSDSPEFKKLALNVIARNSSTEEIFQLRVLFEQIDNDRTGVITYDEFQRALAGVNYPDDVIRSMFEKVVRMKKPDGWS